MPPARSPTYERLRQTIAERMRMRPIELMLMELPAAVSAAGPVSFSRSWERTDESLQGRRLCRGV